MSGRPVNAIKGKQGFQRTGRADPLEMARVGIPVAPWGPADPAPAPPGYTDVHRAFLAKSGRRWAGGFTEAPVAASKSLAVDESTMTEDLDRIAGESLDASVLTKVARHENVSAAALHAMAMRLDHEDYEDVICRIGESSKALPDTMRLLAQSKSEKVKVWAAWHDNTPAECHAAFRDHRDAAVRQGSAENPGAPSETLFYLGNALYEGDGACRTAAKANASYPSVEERTALASHAGTPILEREMLAWDSNARVRKAAREAFGDSRPSADELADAARRRGLPRHKWQGIADRKRALEDRTSGVADE
jgi:hypothetical protein